MRKLYIFPIIHTDIELRNLGQLIKKEFLKQKGLAEWKRRKFAINHLWDRIEKEIEGMQIDYKKLRIYQDSLSTEIDIDIMVKEMLEKGSRNYILINKIIIRGARLMGTENSALLLEEYNRLHNNNAHFSSAKELLDRRDRFIAQRIGITLLDGEVGLIFIGANHNVAKFLPSDMQITNLYHLKSN